MQSIYYRPGKSALAALGAGCLALLCAWIWMREDSTMIALGALLFGVCAALGMRNALSTRPALQFDAQTLVIDKFSGSVKLSWRQVQQITIEQITMRYMGVIPVSKQQFLVVRADGGLFGSTNHRLSASTIQLPPGGIGGLCTALTAMQLAAVGETGLAMKGAGAQGWGAERSPAPRTAVTTDEPEPSPFDADAAIARYLAQKQAAAAEQQSAQPAVRPVRPTFGRKAG